MSINELRSKFPEYSKDTKLNLSRVMETESAGNLTEKQLYLIALSCAYTTKSKTVVDAVMMEAKDKLSETEIDAAKAASSIMAMNNIYYRFVHTSSHKNITQLPVNLRMQIIASHGIDKVSFELAALAVSAINGCGLCVDSHISEVVKHGITPEGVQATIRIAAVINATAQTVFIENL